MKKYSVLVECTIKMYKEFEVCAEDEKAAKKQVKNLAQQEDPFKDVGWRSEDAPRMTVEDCEVL
jgi:uncharacterized protein with ATP-grasp and redox domains